MITARPHARGPRRRGRNPVYLITRPVLRVMIGGMGMLLLWHAVIAMTGVPPFILPTPASVGHALCTHYPLLARAALQTMTEIAAGFGIGAVGGSLLAIAMAAFPRLAAVLRPALLFSQVIPIFALAPMLTLWLGYGMAPKITVAALICFFPVASAFLDGLVRGAPGVLDLGRTMGAGRWRMMWHLRIPLALPHLASGLKLAAIYAPIGAVIGEWVGGSDGLGAVMIHANGRMRIDLSFAALALITLIALGFHGAVSAISARLMTRFS